MEVGPLARMLMLVATGHPQAKELVDRTLVAIPRELLRRPQAPVEEGTSPRDRIPDHVAEDLTQKGFIGTYLELFELAVAILNDHMAIQGAGKGFRHEMRDVRLAQARVCLISLLWPDLGAFQEVSSHAANPIERILGRADRPFPRISWKHR